MFHRRLYFVIPDENQAVQVVADLNAGGVDRRHIHAIAGKGILLTKLPAANARGGPEICRSSFSHWQGWCSRSPRAFRPAPSYRSPSWR